MPRPRLSILIPNFNNGRASSRSGERDFIGDLFQSLMQTLADDPTPLEILVADDGSTDDSLATCRAWARRPWTGWRGDQPFCQLLEREHCGVLSVVANELTRRARGEICCRLDGDIILHTPRWAEALLAIFRSGPPDLGIVGPKQLAVDGSIHSAGSWILHPRGHHHVAQGAPRHAVARSIEVDHVMGCFYCHRRAIWEELGGYDEDLLRGQTVDFGLRARLAGWRTISVPTIEFTHGHAERGSRSSHADSEAGVEATLDRFRQKWGFDRLAPDLDEVARRHAGTPLLWNARVFGPASAWPPPSPGPIEITRSEWARYAADEPFRSAIDRRADILNDLGPHVAPRQCVAVVNCRAGVLCHVLAQRGLTCVGIDADHHALDLARRMTGEQTYPADAPTFVQQEDPRRLPLADGAVDTLLLSDVLETHPNPVGLYAEAHRVLGDGGIVVVVARERQGPFDLDQDVLHAYRPHELLLQVQGTRCFLPLPLEVSHPIAGALILVAERRENPARAFYPSAAGALAGVGAADRGA